MEPLSRLLSQFFSTAAYTATSSQNLEIFTAPHNVSYPFAMELQTLPKNHKNGSFCENPRLDFGTTHDHPGVMRAVFGLTLPILVINTGFLLFMLYSSFSNFKRLRKSSRTTKAIILLLYIVVTLQIVQSFLYNFM